MICNFFEFKFIQFKNKYYRIKKSIDRDAFFVYILWHFVSRFLRALAGSSFLLVQLSNHFLKKSNFFLASPKLFSRIFRKPSKFFRDFFGCTRTIFYFLRIVFIFSGMLLEYSRKFFEYSPIFLDCSRKLLHIFGIYFPHMIQGTSALSQIELCAYRARYKFFCKVHGLGDVVPHREI